MKNPFEAQPSYEPEESNAPANKHAQESGGVFEGKYEGLEEPKTVYTADAARAFINEHNGEVHIINENGEAIAVTSADELTDERFTEIRGDADNVLMRVPSEE